MALNKFYYTYLLIFASFIGWGQSFYKVIGTSGNDYAEQVINDRDSGYVVVGGTEGLGQGEMDGYMVKLDTAGNIEWTRTFGDENVDWLTSVVLLDDGMLACGYTNSNGDYQMYIVRTNEMGQVVWEKEMGNDNWEFPQELTLINDTTVIIAGEVYQNGETTTDGLLVSVTINGDSLWYQTYGGLYDDMLERVICSDSGQVYVCGNYTVEEDDSDYWIGRVDLQGNMIWELFLGDTLNDHAHGITELITGEFIVTGGDAGVSGTNVDNIFYKIDSNGNVLYQNVLNNPNDDIGIDVLSYPDTNKFILINQTSSVGFGGFDTWLFDCNYYTFGVEDFSFAFGTADDEWVVDADTTFDKGVVCVGNMTDPTLGNVIFVHKTDSEDNALFTYQSEEDLEVSEISSKGLFYPNPVMDVINLKDLTRLQGEFYEIYDVRGRVLVSGVISENVIPVKLNGGFYLLKAGDMIWRFTVQP